MYVGYDNILPVHNAPGKVTIFGRRLALYQRGQNTFRPRKGGGAMVTYSELYLLLTLIVSVIALVVNITTKKK